MGRPPSQLGQLRGEPSGVEAIARQTIGKVVEQADMVPEQIVVLVRDSGQRLHGYLPVTLRPGDLPDQDLAHDRLLSPRARVLPRGARLR
jgi:hypothetical protein